MKRKIVIGLLALGALGGFASGFAHLSWNHHRAERAAEVCVDAALAEVAGEAPPQRHQPEMGRFERHVAERCADEARRRAAAS